MSNTTKRAATSPPQEDSDEKRACLSTEDSSFDVDSEDTIIHSNFLSSTLLDSQSTDPAMSHNISPLVGELKAALGDPSILDMISQAVAATVTAQVKEHLRKEIGDLKEIIERKDSEIILLTDRVDELEQYGRRNNMRVTGIPETEGESTDTLVTKLAEKMGVDVTEDMLDRTHRVGRKPEGDRTPVPAQPRAIIVKFTTYRAKVTMMSNRRMLAKLDVTDLVPNATWPDLPASRTAGRRPGTGGSGSTSRRVFLNDDLTRVRAKVAARARALKRENKLQDTWDREGVIFCKRGDSIYKITTERELSTLVV
eukprot:TRINITY_DN92305_c0_g1_i2.p1 TRINITY_DN92305_c0_g1~~TRINITY_DN92305_c0_g1_i2.p1  ORF type:complete len:311 (-),score=57.34 TRINITY_DN92305_c0_g1_i2:195-1127(-)